MMSKFPFAFHSVFLLIISSVLLISCNPGKEERDFDIHGTWALERIMLFDGETVEFPDEDNSGWLRVYDDSCFYECRIVPAPNGTMVLSSRKQAFTLVDKGAGEYFYMQDDNTQPLKVQDDSTMVIQEMGRKYVWKITDDFDVQQVGAIVDCVRHSVDHDEGYTGRYVFSHAERQLQTFNHTLVYILIFIVLVLMSIVHYAYRLGKHKKRVEQELKRIEQERQAMPAPVRAAMDSVEAEFRHSDFYLSLRRKISNGNRLTQEDWDGIEARFKSVYPRFASTLLTLCRMSQVELQVCCLIKLDVPPSEIAGVVCKDASTVSSIRSRLYMKVFGKKGSSRDWDEFIRSL